VLQAQLVLLELTQQLQDQQELLVQLVQQVRKAQQGLQVLKVRLVPQEKLVFKVLRAQLD
jgi:hypothetical protein